MDFIDNYDILLLVIQIFLLTMSSTKPPTFTWVLSFYFNSPWTKWEASVVFYFQYLKLYFVSIFLYILYLLPLVNYSVLITQNKKHKKPSHVLWLLLQSLPITPAFLCVLELQILWQIFWSSVYFLSPFASLLKCHLCLSCNIFILCSQSFFFSDLMKFSYLTLMKHKAITISFQGQRHHIFVCTKICGFSFIL